MSAAGISGPGEWSPQGWQRLKTIFSAALEREEASRDAYLREACAGDPELLDQCRRLLQEAGRADDFLSSPPALPPRAVPAPQLEPGQLLAGRFRIVRFLARGGMGDVYESEDLELNARVALKRIRSELAANPQVLAQFKQEVRAARRVSHLNACRIFDLEKHVGAESGEIFFLTMELLEGQTLARRLKQEGPLTAGETLPLIEQMAAALESAHQQGVIHRDFKPGNVMLVEGAEGGVRAVVTDFGLAVWRRGGAGNPALAAGTPAYMAPEQRRGQAISEATDVYALGLVIGAMVGGRRLAAADGAAARVHLPQACRGWQPIVDRCLEEDPWRRYRSPLEVARALRKRAGRAAWKPGARRLLAQAALLAMAVWILAAAPLPKVASGPAAAPPGLMANRQVHDGGAGGFAAPSPDGKSLVITNWKNGNLALLDLASGKIRDLTRKQGGWNRSIDAARGAVFSRRGDRIAYAWSGADKGGVSRRGTKWRSRPAALCRARPAGMHAARLVGGRLARPVAALAV